MRPARKHVLCVDDHEDTCQVLAALLGQEGYAAQATSTQQEALTMARARRFDLYVIDNRLPDGSGAELCRELRALDPHVPVVIYSGAAYPKDHEAAAAAGVTAYVNKPDVERLISTVKELLPE